MTIKTQQQLAQGKQSVNVSYFFILLAFIIKTKIPDLT